MDARLNFFLGGGFPDVDDVPALFIPDVEAVEYGFLLAGEAGAGIPPVIDEDILHIVDGDVREDEMDEDIGRPLDEDEDEETDHSSDWTDGSDGSESEDSGYESMYEEEEDEDEEEKDEEEDEDEEEEDEDEDFFRPCCPLLQQLLPAYPPAPAGPPIPARPFLPIPRPRPPIPAGPSTSAGPEESPPSTSGLGPSLKSITEASAAAQDGAKRQRRGSEDVNDEQPFTSRLSTSTLRRFWQAPVEDSDSD